MIRFIMLLLLGFSLSAQAVIETYEFDNEVLQVRYNQFIQELRCPKCQNQNLAGSNSPISEDLRRELHRLLEEGNSDQQIVDYMVSRYGDFILYRPRFNPETALLWLAPGIFLALGGVLIVIVFLRQKRSTQQQDAEKILDTMEQEKLQQLLMESSEDAVVGSDSNKDTK
jgi:cytochrome c-type biogenesis protein CcmH